MSVLLTLVLMGGMSSKHEPPRNEFQKIVMEKKISYPRPKIIIEDMYPELRPDYVPDIPIPGFPDMPKRKWYKELELR